MAAAAAATRDTLPPLPVTCGACRREWTTPAKHHSTIRCPACGHPHRVRRPGALDGRSRAARALKEANGPPRQSAIAPRLPAIPKTRTVPALQPPPQVTPPRLPVPARKPPGLPALPPAQPQPGPGLPPQFTSNPAYCEACRGWPLGPSRQPRLNAIARVQVPGSSPVDLCGPHRELAAWWLAAEGEQLEDLDFIPVPPGAPQPRPEAAAPLREAVTGLKARCRALSA